MEYDNQKQKGKQKKRGIHFFHCLRSFARCPAYVDSRTEGRALQRPRYFRQVYFYILQVSS